MDATPNITPTPVTMVTITGAGTMPQHTVINEYAVMSIPAVWRGVNWLAGTLASLPKAVNQQQGKVYQPAAHPLNRLLGRQMNGLTIPFVFWETFFHHCVIWGNGYGLIQRQPGTLKTIGIWNVDPEKVIPFRHQGAKWYLVKDLIGPGEPDVVPAADMIHVPGLGYDGMQGYPLVSMLAETFEWAKNAQRFSARYFRQGTQVQGSLECPKQLSNDQKAQLLDMIRRRHSGIETNYDYMILSDGMTLKNSTISPQQSQMIETTEAANLAIARILGVPPFYVYEMGRATWGNATQQAEDAVKFSLRPWIEKTEEELAAKLLTDNEQDTGLAVRFDVEDLVRGDAQTISSTTIAEVNAGLRTVNEARARLGEPRYDDPEADKLRVPVNFPVPGGQIAPTLPAPAKHSTEPAGLTLASLQPVIDEAVSRVDTKTKKAFENKAQAPPDQRTTWATNVFAHQQAEYVRAALAPIGQLVDLPVDLIADRYAAAIRRRAATGEERSLADIIHDLTTGRDNAIAA